MDVGFLGLGPMGAAIADRNHVPEGHGASREGLRQRDAEDHVQMTLKRGQFTPVSGLPQFQTVIVAGRDEQRSVGRKIAPFDDASVRHKVGDHPMRRHIP
jgi:hypothetical protein